MGKKESKRKEQKSVFKTNESNKTWNQNCNIYTPHTFSQSTFLLTILLPKAITAVNCQHLASVYHRCHSEHVCRYSLSYHNLAQNGSASKLTLLGQLLPKGLSSYLINKCSSVFMVENSEMHCVRLFRKLSTTYNHLPTSMIRSTFCLLTVPSSLFCSSQLFTFAWDYIQN